MCIRDRVYVAPRTRFDKEAKLDSRPFHLILLCKNNKGYQNLIKLVSLSYTEGGRRPRNRGVVMNPVDHPMGGGEGRSSGGHPRSRKGLYAKGLKTCLLYTSRCV